MKKEAGLVFVAYFLISLSAFTVAYAIERDPKVITIAKMEDDITGDHQNESIVLKGEPYDDDDSYLKKIFIEITASNGKNYTISLDSGSKASIKLIDLNQDGLNDLFASVLTGGSGGITQHYLHTLKDFADKDLTVPEPIEMDAKYLNGYKAKIKLKNTGQTYLFDIKDRKKYYKKLGLYYKGRLNEPTELTVNPYSSLEPIPLGKSKMGLKGVQRVTGLANADTIALVESVWVCEKGHWKLIRTAVKKAQ